MTIINKVTGQLAHITTYDPDTGDITGFDPVGNINLGPISNITIAGGTAGQVITTDGNGVLSFEDGGGNYSNANVANYLPTYTGNLDTTDSITTSNLSVGNSANLGAVANVTITGGSAGQYLQTDGSGVLSWAAGSTSVVPAIYFPVAGAGNNQSFSNSFLASYVSNTDITLFYNGVLLENTYYTLAGDTITINTTLDAGDSIEIIQTAAASVNIVTGTYGNSNVATYLANAQVQDVIPAGNAVYSLGSLTNQWKDLWVSNATIYFNSVPLSANNNTLTFAGEPILVSGGDTNITTTGTIEVGGMVADGNIQANSGYFFIGDGGLLSNISGTGNYSNANVANYLPTYSGNLSGADISASGNISAVGEITSFANVVAAPGAFFLGDGGLLSNIAPVYGNANVANYLPTYTGNLPLVDSLVASTLAGDGSLITNITGGYVVGDVANAAYSVLAGSAATVYDNAQPNINSVGTLTSLVSSGNITIQAGGFFLGDGGLLSNIAPVYSNANVASYLPTYTGNLGNVDNITASGTITGNGAGLSDIAGANVTGQVSSALFAGQVYNSDQPTITTVGELTSLDVTGNITLGAGGFFIGDGGLLSNISGGGSGYGNGDVALYLPTYTGNLGNVDSITTTGNITVGTGSYIIGDGTYLTNVPGASAEGAFTIETASFSAVAGVRYGVDTTGGAVTATLPATPAAGQAIFFADAGGAYATNNLTVSPNGQTIMGDTGDLIVNTPNQNFGLFWSGSTWRTY